MSRDCQVKLAGRLVVCQRNNTQIVAKPNIATKQEWRIKQNKIEEGSKHFLRPGIVWHYKLTNESNSLILNDRHWLRLHNKMFCLKLITGIQDWIGIWLITNVTIIFVSSVTLRYCYIYAFQCSLDLLNMLNFSLLYFCCFFFANKIKITINYQDCEKRKHCFYQFEPVGKC